MGTRVLIDRSGAAVAPEPSDEDLARLYDVPRRPWLRANMVSTLDGAAAGPDGRTGSINNAADKRVFHLLRGLADAIVVGAGTARTERYGPAVRPLVLVTRSGSVPAALEGAPRGRVLLATCSQAPGLAAARDALGEENVLELGDLTVDLRRLTTELAGRGLTSLLCEGGPQLLTELLELGLVDELCTTQVPRLVGGGQLRMTSGAALDRAAELRLLLESGGTLLARWFLGR